MILLIILDCYMSVFDSIPEGENFDWQICIFSCLNKNFVSPPVKTTVKSGYFFDIDTPHPQFLEPSH